MSRRAAAHAGIVTGTPRGCDVHLGRLLLIALGPRTPRGFSKLAITIGRVHMKIEHALTAAFAVALASQMLPIDADADEASDCNITITRTACPGHEAESYKKCDGKQSCSKPAPATSEAACVEAAIKSCSNDRLEITKSKVITATYKGKALETKAGKDDLCLDYAKRDAEFNHCGK